MTVDFTKRTVQSLTAPPSGRLDVFDGRLAGFGLRLSASGARTWFVMFRARGRLRRFTLGSAAVFDLDTARLEAQKVLLAARTGSDPAADRHARREAERANRQREDDSFAALAAQYLEKHAKVKKRSWRYDERIFQRDVLPAFGRKPAREVRATSIEALLDRITERNAPALAERTFAVVRRVFNFAIKNAQARERFGVTANPCAGIDTDLLPEKRSRERVLTGEEIRQLWEALTAEDQMTAAIFKLGLLTAQRPGEVRTMRRENLDLEGAAWTIPAERSKNNLAHRVPLSAEALALLQAVIQSHNSPWVFPSDSKTGCRTTIEKAAKRLRRAIGVADWRPHDLRRTAASHMAAAGVPRLTISKILNHVETGVTRVYDRHGYDPEKRQALDAWARRLHAIVTGEPPAKVVALRSA